MSILVFPSVDELARHAAASFVKHAASAIASDGRFVVALSGGRTPLMVFRLLAGDDFAKQVDWEKVHFFWGDERTVPPDHPDSNFRLAYDNLLRPLAIQPSNIHRVATEHIEKGMTVNNLADSYHETLRAFFGGGPCRFHLIHLGLGEDGHTASLFPHTSALDEKRAIVVANDVPQLQTTRITFTASLINGAQAIEFLVTGAKKAAILRDVLYGERQERRYPSQMICPVDGTLTWLVTEDAAAELPDRAILPNEGSFNG